MSGPPGKIEQGENVSCEECGQFGALEIAARCLCPECVALAGCGCAGHGDEAA
jgi:hypothetical protein